MSTFPCARDRVLFLASEEAAQRGYISDLISHSWQWWNLALNPGLSDPKVQPFPILLLWESLHTAIVEAKGVNGSAHEEYIDSEDKMAKDRTWAESIRLNGTHRR